MALRSMAAQAATILRIRCQPHLAQALAIPLARGFATTVPIPQDLKFLESHEWVKVESGTGTVGISDHAQHELGDVVFADLPEIGSSVTKGKNFGVVESVKACSDIYSPVSGEVIEVNEEVKQTPALVNKNAFGEGWLIKVKMSNVSDLDGLMDPAAYEEHVKSGGH
ncbi:hypothetical protein SELMODRAFT_129640 [Selaginella moellendorffii]|uniref:Glycine cleavage system H protein n=1 Tax=Selaginella moellendorffii TaxID=88036 RepID=D8T153_SELML|nr:hypothetical protein SELMODRAFT_129640 [Selaginella moellendorffii]